VVSALLSFAAPVAGQQASQTRAEVESGAISVDGIPAGPPTATYNLAGREPFELLAALHQGVDEPEAMTLWVGRGARYSLAHVVPGAEDPGVGRLEAPTRFTLDGEVFVHVQLTVFGTGGIHEDAIFHLTRAGTLEVVELQDPATAFAPQLRPGEGVWKGTFYDFQDDDLRFEFQIWNAGDGNCCPTAGWVEGTLRVERVPGAESRLRLVTDVAVRHAPEPDPR